MHPCFRVVTYSLMFSAIFFSWDFRLEGQEKKAAPTVMERKLKHAQNLLNGLALKDFDQIVKEADALIAVREEATWKINETEQYLRHSNAFLEQLQKIKKSASNKNLDGATLAYVDMTMTCIKCHETLRIQKGKFKDD